MTSLRDGKPLDASKNYVVTGWASVNEGTQGPPVYDVVTSYIEKKKVIQVPSNDSIKVVV